MASARSPLGITRRTRRCWEFGRVTLGGHEGEREEEEEEEEDELLLCGGRGGDRGRGGPGGAAPAGGVRVLSAWFGNPDDPAQRRDITPEVKAMLADRGPGVQVPATTAVWGDPAQFRVKRLEVTYEYDWLAPEERDALEALRRRANEKAQCAADFEELVGRLGGALLNAASGPPGGASAGSDAVAGTSGGASAGAGASSSSSPSTAAAACSSSAAPTATAEAAAAAAALAASSSSAPATAAASATASSSSSSSSSSAPAALAAPAAEHASSAATSSTSRPESPLGRTSPRWKFLGFQSCDPRTDLRTGRLAVEALIYLAERYPMAAQQMIVEAQSDGVDYPFAVASINVTQLLARYLRLISDGGAGSVGSPNASWQAAPRHVVRRFSRLLLQRDGQEGCRGEDGHPCVDVFGEFHAAAMARLHASWRATKERDPLTTIMVFPTVLDEMMGAVHDFCLRSVLRSALEFRALATYVCCAGVLSPTSPRMHSGPSLTRALLSEEDPQEGTLLATVGRGARAVSDAASFAGTYLRGILAGQEAERPRGREVEVEAAQARAG